MSRWKEWKTAPAHVRDSKEYFISPYCDWMHFFLLLKDLTNVFLCQREQVSKIVV